jgi:opacity protein-like surface antigen
MKKTLLAAAALVVVVASPAFAQSYDPDLGSGNVTQWYDNGDHLHSNPDPNWGAPYNSYYDYYAQVPGWYHGHRSPYAQYDQNGRLIDQNLPDRW